jgi:hypothetical protein
VRVQVGVTDGVTTELITTDVHEGDRVVTDAEGLGDGKGAPAGANAFRRLF